MTAADSTTPKWGGLFRYSLRQLFIATAFVAIGCYALRWASPWWAIVLFYCGLALIGAGILIAFNRGGESRSFWGGFSICGIAHLLLIFHPGLDNGIPSLFPAAFVTTWASAWTYHGLRPALTVEPMVVSKDELNATRGRRQGGYYSPNEMQMTEVNAGEDGYFRAIGPGPYYVQEADFVEVAHGLWTLLLAYLGGCISLAIYRTRPEERRLD